MADDDVVLVPTVREMLESNTVPELRAFAEEFEIDLQGERLKEGIVDVIEKVIVAVALEQAQLPPIGNEMTGPDADPVLDPAFVSIPERNDPRADAARAPLIVIGPAGLPEGERVLGDRGRGAATIGDLLARFDDLAEIFVVRSEWVDGALGMHYAIEFPEDVDAYQSYVEAFSQMFPVVSEFKLSLHGHPVFVFEIRNVGGLATEFVAEPGIVFDWSEDGTWATATSRDVWLSDYVGDRHVSDVDNRPSRAIPDEIEVVDEPGEPEHFIPDMTSGNELHRSMVLHGLEATVGMFVGASSVLWDPMPDGVFASERASAMVSAFTKAVEAYFLYGPKSKLPVGVNLD